MSGLRGVVKDGWHPKGKQGGKESWRGDFKGINQVAGWMGKGRDPHQEQQEHISRPLSTLKDPSSFGPPPRNANYHGGVALPNKTTPDTRGWGAPLAQEDIQTARAEEEAARQAEEEAANSAPPPPSVPYRVDTTGLSTDHLPKPPVMRVDVNEMKVSGNGAQSRPKPKPSLPPRLPPRQNSNPTEFTPAPPPSYDNVVQPTSPPPPQLNQGAVSRLGQAGVSVPGFNIGESNPWNNGPTARTPPAPAVNNAPQMNELQSRFAKMTASPPPAEAPAQGTTWEQKQNAVRTANSFRNNPSSVSVSDAKTAASTANNFRERHSEQIASVGRAAGNLDKKYNLTKRFNSFTSQHSSPPPEETAAPASPPPNLNAIAKKKPPPPPPPKKPAFTAPSTVSSPPPLPIGTKPKPS